MNNVEYSQCRLVIKFKPTKLTIWYYKYFHLILVIFMCVCVCACVSVCVHATEHVQRSERTSGSRFSLLPPHEFFFKEQHICIHNLNLHEAEVICAATDT